MSESADLHNARRMEFLALAAGLDIPPTDLENLWRAFHQLQSSTTSSVCECPPAADALPANLVVFIDNLRNLSIKALNRNLNFKAILNFVKKIKYKILAVFSPPPVISAQISSLFDELEYELTANCIRLAIQPYHRKLREANRYILHEKRRYYTVFNRMREPAFIIDHELRLVETNRAFGNFFKLAGKEHIGRLCLDIIAQDSLSRDQITRALAARTSFPSIETALKIDDEEKNVIISGTFLGDINREFSGGIIIIQDITHQKNYERALLKSEEKYRSLIENVPDITWRADQHGSIYFISPNIEKICGYRADDMLDGSAGGIFSGIHPDDLDYVKNEFGLFFASHLPSGHFLRNLLRQAPESLNDERINDGRKVYDVKYRFKHENGAWIWLHGRASNVYEQDGTWFTDGIFSDVTALKMAEEELERHHFRLSELVDERTTELREANKNLELEIGVRKQAENGLLELARKLKQSNEELEQFAHVASHDLKEPLMLITAFSQRLVDKYSGKLDKRGQEYLHRIIKSTAQMEQLINGLLELSRVTSCKKPFEQLDLGEIVNEVSQNLEERIKQNRCRIKFKNLGELAGDKTQIRQLFQNIIANAIKYRTTDKDPLITIKSSIEDGDLYKITIRDNGIGFDPVYAERIFQPMIRLHGHQEYEGTGIGLATCQKIVSRHGGEIKAQSTPGQGATFIVKLPIRRNILST